ncbi:hypothetical protein, partial [Bacteroides ovatus]|uniref:hypothetical protein n=1 Tax=Bacteroides ovatus TaxID=28116 RepID=UPI001897C2A1
KILDRGKSAVEHTIFIVVEFNRTAIIQNVYASEVIFPDENGEIKFTVSRKEGDYIPLNVLKIEEYTNVEK